MQRRARAALRVGRIGLQLGAPASAGALPRSQPCVRGTSRFLAELQCPRASGCSAALQGERRPGACPSGGARVEANPQVSPTIANPTIVRPSPRLTLAISGAIWLKWGNPPVQARSWPGTAEQTRELDWLQDRRNDGGTDRGVGARPSEPPPYQPLSLSNSADVRDGRSGVETPAT